MGQMTVKELRGHLNDLCDAGLGDLPVSTEYYNEKICVPKPLVVHVATAPDGTKSYFSQHEVENGYPKSHGYPAPPPTFVVVW